jgi:hypothetical protein
MSPQAVTDERRQHGLQQHLPLLPMGVTCSERTDGRKSWTQASPIPLRGRSTIDLFPKHSTYKYFEHEVPNIP